MEILECIQSLHPGWQGTVWANDYDRIIPHETEKRPVPSLPELEAAWVEIQAAKGNQEAFAKLNELDLQSIREIRKYISQKPDTPQELKAIESLAEIERMKVLVRAKTEG